MLARPIDLDFNLDIRQLERVKAEGPGADAGEGLLMPPERANAPVKLSLPLVNTDHPRRNYPPRAIANLSRSNTSRTSSPNYEPRMS